MGITSKAERIRQLLSEGKSTKEVAAIVGCHDAYVRVAGRQRAQGKSVAQARYEGSNPDYVARMHKRVAARWMERYRSDPEFALKHKERTKAANKERYWKDAAYREAVKARGRTRYHSLRDARIAQ